MHYYEFNIKSYHAATAHLTNDEDLAYRRLMDMYYDTEEPIPTALPLLARRLRVGIPELESVLAEFFFLTDKGWEHGYCNEKIEKYHSFIARQKANGSKGGRGKKADAKPDKPTALPDKPNAKPTNNHKPVTINQEPLTKEKKGVDSHESPRPQKWTEEDREMAKVMLEAIQVIAPSEKGGKSWPDDIRKLRELDNHSHEEIMSMFRFANTHHFWQSNILSPAKLRKQWSRLEAERGKAKPRNSHSGFDKIDYSAGINEDGSF